MPNPVPEMDQVHKDAWKQPDPNKWDFDTIPGHVILPKKDLDRLSRYDTTLPSSVYEGKMWCSEIDNVDYLYWYGVGPLPNTCSIERQIIILLECIDLLTSGQ